MSETWKQWAGRTIDGRFPLQSYLGGSGHSAVFVTVPQPGGADSEKAAIKLIPADADAKQQFLRWKAASELAHPNLIRVFEAGRCELDGTELLYVVTEYAEENLSQILPERALTAEEARGMLPPVLRALQYVHHKGFVHGHIQPSNILAVGDQVKLSSDTLSAPGEKSSSAHAMSVYDPPEAAAGTISEPTDVWQLGMTLIEVLTQRLPVWDRARSNAPEVPGGVPEPFREIIRQCLQVDAGKRWTIAGIVGRLQGKQPDTTSSETQATPKKIAALPAPSNRLKVSAKWRYLLVLAAVVAIAFLLIPRPKSPGPGEVRLTHAGPVAGARDSQSARASNPPASTSSPGTPVDTKTSAANADETGVARRVMPQVSPSARRTIQGTIKVRVRVDVDDAGSVTKAKLESAGPSKYFSRVAMEAAREWKFAPARAGESGVRQWRLQFAFSRAKTGVSAVRPARRSF